MNWMDKLERKWGRHAVANLSRYFVLAQVIGYVVQLTAPGLMSYMNFDMGKIYMMITVAIVPIIIVYLLLSKYIIASFLSRQTPAYNETELRKMFYDHLDMERQQMEAYLDGDYETDIEIYLRSQQNMIELADFLTSGLLAR